jgi:rubrerythrin
MLKNTSRGVRQMPKWLCPACGGGFPELKDELACPWCEFMLEEAASLRERGDFSAVNALGKVEEAEQE